MNSGSSYTPGREIARGGMGAILEAKDQSLDREVAMKVMLGDDEGSSSARQRFVREALVLARLEHPNIVPIHEMGRNAEGQLFYTMKMVKGRTLQAILDAIKQGDTATTEHYTLDRLLTIYRKVCDAVAFAHHHRIIHRDLKPENVMVGKFGEVLVMDWGLAKHLDDERHAKTEAESAQAIEGFQELNNAQLATSEGGLTMDGSVMGSPQYMPPEQAEGRLADIGTHSDIYSLGGVLYTILTLRPPVEGRRVSEVLNNVKSGNITPPTQHSASRARNVKTTTSEVADASEAVGLPHCPDGEVPASLSAVTMRALAFQPAARYADVQQIVADVEAYQGGFATSAEQANTVKLMRLFIRRNKVLTVAAALVVLVTVGFLGKVISSERKATANALRAEANEAAVKATLADLRRTAPVFFAQAKVDFEGGKLTSALEKLGYAIQLEDANPDFYLYRAHLQQSSQALVKAADDYRRALALRPTDESAKLNLALCEKLLRESGGGALKRAQQTQLLASLKTQARLLEAVPLAIALNVELPATRAAILSRLRDVRRHKAGDALRVDALPDGTFRIDFSAATMDDFSVLKGLPISSIKFTDSLISDLRSLAELPLRELSLTGTKITDLSPLRGMPLEHLSVSGLDRNGAVQTSPLTDLSPLRGMKLKVLQLVNTEVSDLSPLAGMALEELNLWRSVRIRDLTPLARCKQLGKLEIRSTQVTDLGPLAGLPLTHFSCSGSSIANIAPLAGAPLKQLALYETRVTDLSPLTRSAKLEFLDLTKSPVSDLEPVAKMPLKTLLLEQTRAAHLDPVAECATLEELVVPSTAIVPPTLRHLPRLKRLSTTYQGGGGSSIFSPNSYARPLHSAEDFWREHDAKLTAKK
jgi:serine/threonine protein kinase/Leucine-rich repeat (LRR) protein